MTTQYVYRVNNLESDDTKSIKIKKGARVILAKSGAEYIPSKYTFEKEYFTQEEADSYIQRLGVEASQPKGRIWSSGEHHVFVDGKPARVHVPQTTLKATYDKMVAYIEANGSLKLGVDHLSDELLSDNGIIKKMNLLDVGEITDITMDDEGIYIKESNLTNTLIDQLNQDGELSMYSIVGAMDAHPCPTGKSEYVLDDLDIERVDFVDEGGCSSCRLDAQPKDMVITAKLSMEAKDTMVDEIKDNEELSEIEQLKLRIAELEAKEEKADEEVAEEVVEGPEEEGVAPVKEEQEEVEAEVVEEPEVVPEPEKEDEEEPEPEEDPVVKQIRELTEKISDMEKQLEGKKAKVEASAPEFDIIKAVDELVGEGRATPKMREALIEYGAVSKDAFDKIAESLPVVVDLKVQAKFAKPKKEEVEDEEKPYTESEEFKKLAKEMGYKF